LGQPPTLYSWMGKESDKNREIFLVLRSQAGDTAAFDELLKEVQAPLDRYISRLAGDEGLAEDILQEVFLIIYRKIGWLREPALFRPWAYRIASRETFARLKKEKLWRDQVREDDVLENAGSLPETDPFPAEEIPRLLSTVSPASRAVLILHYLDDLSLAETGGILGISTGTVKSRLAYGLQRLRQVIKEGNT
jgi:RNA polymerase sigma-70 factor, ECF subfamily